jgi:hypothetical protein
MHIGEAVGKFHSFLTSALDGFEWSTSRSGHFALGKNPGPTEEEAGKKPDRIYTI